MARYGVPHRVMDVGPEVERYCHTRGRGHMMELFRILLALDKMAREKGQPLKVERAIEEYRRWNKEMTG